MKALAPWTRLPTLRQELDRLFSGLDEDVLAPAAIADWMPSVEITETDAEFVVKAECPGMDVKDIRVRMEDGVLTIEGEKKSDREVNSDRCHRQERTFGSFSRGIRFPRPTDGSKVKARLANGVLTLTVPKAASAAGRDSIPIQVG